MAVSLSSNALWGGQLQAQGDITVRFHGTVPPLTDSGSFGNILTTGSMAQALARDSVPLTRVFLTVIIDLLGAKEKVLRTARREAAAVSMVYRDKRGQFNSLEQTTDDRQ